MKEKYELFINGEWTPSLSSDYFATYNPANGDQLSMVARAKTEDVTRAVVNSKTAFLIWRDTLPVQRGRILYQIAHALLDNIEELARIETLDNGKPLTQSRLDVQTAARYFEFYAGIADKINGETIPLGPNYHSYTVREPIGVTGHILPWNAPIQQAARGIAPALAAGNTVVAKPAEQTPLTCLELARICFTCGLPAGVFNVIPGFGEEAGAALVSHQDVKKIAFTGSVETGSLVMRNASNSTTPVSLELGGKSPNIVFEDADLDAAARSSLIAIFFNAGQVCSAGSRLLVQNSIYEKFVEKMVNLTKNIKIGPGIEDPYMGPLSSQEQFSKVRKYINLGKEQGAKVAIGGGIPSDPIFRDGYYIQPTIFTEVKTHMRIAQEEIFGPVLCMMRFQDEEDAISIANDTKYGLVAGIWTRDLSRAHRVASKLEAGQVFINEYFAGGVETPFGGTKLSGFGREKGVEALEHYTQVKSITVRV